MKCCLVAKLNSKLCRLINVLEEACLPRARGFTGSEGRRRRSGRVSSPCAGVHRPATATRPLRRRVFPVRGGSPITVLPVGIREQCLPRARGFTVVDFRHAGSVRVSSPCAGVHPLPSCHVSTMLRVFPVRGGSPVDMFYSAIEGWCLPRARGFTDVPGQVR